MEQKEVFASKPWIRVSREKIKLPDGRIVDDYHQLHLVSCVVIFALTDDQQVVIERQYKHGVKKITWMLPTGGIDDGEDPLDAAKREFLEETGYTAREWRGLGSFPQMGNYGGAFSHFFLARGARKITEPIVSDLEEMEILLKSPQELLQAIQNGQVCVLNDVTAILLALRENPS